MELNSLQNKGPKMRLSCAQRFMLPSVYAAELHCEIEDLVDLGEITEEMKQRPERQFCFNDGVRFEHIMVKP